MIAPTPREMVRLQVAMAAESSAGEIRVSRLFALCREFGSERGTSICHYLIRTAYQDGCLRDARSFEPHVELDV